MTADELLSADNWPQLLEQRLPRPSEQMFCIIGMQTLGLINAADALYQLDVLTSSELEASTPRAAIRLYHEVIELAKWFHRSTDEPTIGQESELISSAK